MVRTLATVGATLGLLAWQQAAAETRTMCELEVSFELAPLPESLPTALKAWQGVWLGSIENGGACTGMVVERIAPDGTISAKMFTGRYLVNTITMSPAMLIDRVAKVESGQISVTTPSKATATYRLADERSMELRYVPQAQYGALKGRLTRQ